MRDGDPTDPSRVVSFLLGELRLAFVFSAVIQTILVLLLDPRLMIVLVIAWAYLTLMGVEFFCREWLRKHPQIYLVSHMGIMPLVDFFATACEWLPRSSSPPSGLGWFLAASFFNGIVIETGRKLRQPADEEEGVETYSHLWGKRGGSTVWLLSLAATFLCAVLASSKIDFQTPVIISLSITFGFAVISAHRFNGASLSGKKIELISALWTLILYLTLGLAPLIIRNLPMITGR